jgi:hypothetical protein
MGQPQAQSPWYCWRRGEQAGEGIGAPSTMVGDRNHHAIGARPETELGWWKTMADRIGDRLAYRNHQALDVGGNEQVVGLSARTAWRAVSSVNTGAAMAVADLDGDGRLDLVADLINALDGQNAGTIGSVTDRTGLPARPSGVYATPPPTSRQLD